MANELFKEVIKIVITLEAGKGWIGVQAKGCDIFFKNVDVPEGATDGTEKEQLHYAWNMVPDVVAEAQVRWETQPLGPSYDRPAAPPTTVAEARPAARRTGRQTPATPNERQPPLL